MNNTILLSFVLLLSSYSFSQDKSTHQLTVDSLRQVLVTSNNLEQVKYTYQQYNELIKKYPTLVITKFNDMEEQRIMSATLTNEEYDAWKANKHKK